MSLKTWRSGHVLRLFGLPLGVLGVLVGACDDGSTGETGPSGDDPCGPTRARVERVIDGDTVALEGGERVRYLMIDTPESTQGATDCFGSEASAFNRELVEGQEITLEYDVRCRDRYDRLLAYISTDAGEINRILVRQGYACVYHIPPNGEDRLAEYRALEAEAQLLGRGLWGACQFVTCVR